MVAKKPPSKERFLLKLLTAIFAFQALLFSFAVVKCASLHQQNINDACPELGRRYDQTFGVMIATVLALLGASKSGPTEN